MSSAGAAPATFCTRSGAPDEERAHDRVLGMQVHDRDGRGRDRKCPLGRDDARGCDPALQEPPRTRAQRRDREHRDERSEEEEQRRVGDRPLQRVGEVEVITDPCERRGQDRQRRRVRIADRGTRPGRGFVHVEERAVRHVTRGRQRDEQVAAEPPRVDTEEAREQHRRLEHQPRRADRGRQAHAEDLHASTCDRKWFARFEREFRHVDPFVSFPPQSRKRSRAIARDRSPNFCRRAELPAALLPSPEGRSVRVPGRHLPQPPSCSTSRRWCRSRRPPRRTSCPTSRSARGRRPRRSSQ